MIDEVVATLVLAGGATNVTAETSFIDFTATLRQPRQRGRVFVLGHFQLTVGTGATALTGRLRRGLDSTAPLVGEGNAETVKTAPAQTEPLILCVTEERDNVAETVYTYTVQQTGATDQATAVTRTLFAFMY